MDSTKVPNSITREQWHRACAALGIPMDFHRMVFRALEEGEREEFMVHNTRTSYYVCEVTWADYGQDQDGNFMFAPVTKKILVNTGITQQERMNQE